MIEIMRKLSPVRAHVPRPVKHFVFHPLDDSAGMGAGPGEDWGVDSRPRHILREEYLPKFGGWNERDQFETEFVELFDAPAVEDEAGLDTQTV